MVQEHVFLKGKRLALFLFNLFKVYHFYMQKLLYPLQNCVMHLKNFFSATIILIKKVSRSCLKMILKIPHKVRNLFVKGFKRLKVDF